MILLTISGDKARDFMRLSVFAMMLEANESGELVDEDLSALEMFKLSIDSVLDDVYENENDFGNIVPVVLSLPYLRAGYEILVDSEFINELGSKDIDFLIASKDNMKRVSLFGKQIFIEISNLGD